MSARLLLLLVLPAAAADFYLAPSEFVVVPGQRIDVTILGVPPEPGRLRDAALYTPKGVYNVVNLRVVGDAVVGDATIPAPGSLVLAVRATPETAAGERRNLYAKALLVSDAADDLFERPTGLAFEILPEANPFRLRPGDRFPIRLVLGGKPAGGIPVTMTSAGLSHPAGRTDPAGRIEALIPAAGTWRLQATVRERCAEPGAADWESWTTSLTFAVTAGDSLVP
ncbi:MAG: DUF4198 domain-containing protein [Acidobacteria bacterium]|nr:DUF4198 domain-containing protein [Acidobacteriota bacterium]